MKVVILAGGMPSTIADEDEKIPKPMAEIGDKPILWHIMKQYSYYGFNDFIICAGYKSQMIKEYFMDYYIYQSDITVDLQKNEVKILRKQTEDWKVSVIDTGVHTPIAERINKIRPYIAEESFILVYGDCVSNIDVNALVQCHKEKHKMATVTVARPTGRNEILKMNESNEICYDEEISYQNTAWVNACNMLLEPAALEYMEKKANFLERGLFMKLAEIKQLASYQHEGFWSPVETKRDKYLLNQMWLEGKAPWKVWEE